MIRALALSAGLALALAGCAPAAAPSSVCTHIAAVKAAPDAAALAALDPHSALGVVWADAQSGCNGTLPAAGVDAAWTASVWEMVKSLAPVVLPILIGLL